MNDIYSRALVTGGAGFIGSHLVDRLLYEGLEVKVLDNFNTGSIDNLAHHQNKKDFSLIKGDIRDLKLLKSTLSDVDVVFHEAALASVTQSVKNPLLTHDVNVTGTLNLLQTAINLNVKRFIYASSAAVYGDTRNPQKREDMNPNPISPYGVSKLAAEKYVSLFFKVYGIETVSLRYFNVYGPRQRFDIDCAYGGAVTIFLNRLLRNLPPVIYGDGEQTRDFIYVQDVIEANLLAARARNAAGEVFNISSGTKISVNQVAETLKDLLNKKHLTNTYSPPRPTDIRHGYADISKAEKLLDYKAKFPVRKGLNELVAWYTATKLKKNLNCKHPLQ